MKKGNETKESKRGVVTSRVGRKTTNTQKRAVIEKKVAKKEKKDNLFKKMAKYFKGVFKEFKRIRWTEKKDLLKYSICTVVFVLLFGVYFYAIDWLVLVVRSLAN